MSARPKIYRLDADSTGTDSIQSYIDEGSIMNIPCPTFSAFDIACRSLQDEVRPGDGVIFDTISSLLDTTRGDMMLGDDPSASLWDQHGKFFGDKQFMNTYRGAQNLTLRRIKNIVNRGAYGIVLAHEAEGKDPMATMKMSVPMVNPAMVDDLIATCSDVFRLHQLTRDLNDETGAVVLEAGHRILQLRRTDDYTAKFHVDPRKRDPDKIPSGIKDPDFAKMVEVLGKIPRCLCVYAWPGVGKTTFGASMAAVLYKEN
jgi:hypothetical protein